MESFSTQEYRSGRFYPRAEKLATKAKDRNHSQREKATERGLILLLGQKFLSISCPAVYSFIQQILGTYYAPDNVIEIC